MSGSPLMCIWHACYVNDGGAQSTGLKQSVLKAVTQQVAAECGASFSAEKFDNFMRPDHVPDFDLYTSYFRSQLMTVIAGNKYAEMIQTIEKSCWNMCILAYQTAEFDNDEDKEHLWQIFNRLTDNGAYPPKAHEAEVTWLTGRLAPGFRCPFKEAEEFPRSGMTLQALLDHLGLVYYGIEMHGTITDVFNYSVLQVILTGWLHKRTRKQSNWSNWQRRWFVCEPRKLSYFENDDRLVKKGEVIIGANARVQSEGSFKSFTRNLSGRFKVMLSKSFHIEMAAGNDSDRDRWVTAIEEIILAARAGVTPLQQKLQDERRKLKSAKRNVTNSDTSSVISTPALPRSTLNTTSSPAGTPPLEIILTEDVPVLKKKQAGTFALMTPQFDANYYSRDDSDKIVEGQRQKMLAIFLKVDKDGNGKLDTSEFKALMIKKLHLKLTDHELVVIFSALDKMNTGYIGFDEFYNYFIKFILDENVTGVESKIRTAFLQTDRDGTGTVDFHEFSDFVWARRQTITAQKIAEIFNQIDEGQKGAVSLSKFRSFLSRHESLRFLASEPVNSKNAGPGPQLTTSENPLEEQFRNLYIESDAGDIITFLRNRWQNFVSFKRVGGSGELVMTGGSGMVADVLPGEYSLLDLACFNDLPPIVPHYVGIKGVQWISSTVPGVSGKLLFPENFDGVLPIDIATNEHLAYYDCSLAGSSQMKVSLLYRHGIQDFTYQNNYLDEYIRDEHKVGGGGLERHDFAHLDCPLDNDSGYFVIGKLVNKTELHLTGFKVPTRHTLYLPGGVIHCNDYLKGTWRTMLSDEADIDHVHIVRSSRKGNVTTMEHFVFSFA